MLVPACDIAGEWKHPVLNATLDNLFLQLRAGAEVLTVMGGHWNERESWARQVQVTHPQFSTLLAIPGMEYVLLTLPGVRMGSAKFSISLDQTAISGMPRLSLADCDPAHFAAEIDAAIECVWPTAG